MLILNNELVKLLTDQRGACGNFENISSLDVSKENVCISATILQRGVFTSDVKEVPISFRF